MERRLKVLISAYACSPFKGSEPGVGWGFVAELSRHHDLCVIVEEEKFREDIERYLAAYPEFGQGVRFFFLRKERNRWLRKLWPPSYYWYYRRWQIDALRLARRLHAEVGFDLVHQLTMVGFREPGYLWQLGIPFVWGPVGGMGLFPWRFLAAVGIYGGMYYFGYNLMTLFQMRFLNRPRRAAQAAGRGIIAATSENQERIYQYWGRESKVITEVGLAGLLADFPAVRRLDEPLRLVWSGQHTPGKALHLALRGLAQLPARVDWALEVLGQGQETGKWKELANRLGIAGRCSFHGWIPRDQALSVMRKGHLSIITSLKDLTSTVIVESLAVGLPVVCLDHCGFSAVIDQACGIRIPVRNPDQVAQDIAAAVESLWDDEPHRRQLAENALQRARNFFWDRKAELVNQVYDQVMRQ